MTVTCANSCWANKSEIAYFLDLNIFSCMVDGFDLRDKKTLIDIRFSVTS